MKSESASPCGFSNSVFSSVIRPLTVFFHIISHLHKIVLFNLITLQSSS